MDIGARIKILRSKNNLTLSELASRTELSKGFLSQVERDLTSPSISTLEDIVLALGTDLENFFKESEEEVIVFKDKDYFIDEKAGLTIKYIVPNAQKNDMEPIILELDVNGKSDEIKPYEGQEFAYVLQGKIALHNLETNKKYVVKKGETFYIKGDFPHQIINENTSLSKVLWISTPPNF